MSMMSDALVVTTAAVVPSPRPSLPPVPWRDPHTVPEQELLAYIQRLEQSCLDQPDSANLRICLGMAYAMNFDVYKSMDALEAATMIDPASFWAQIKYAELHYRLRALNRAEELTRKAMDLAETSMQLSVARRQMQEIRRLSHDSARNVTWDKPLTAPTLVLSAMMVILFVVMTWK